MNKPSKIGAGWQGNLLSLVLGALMPLAFAPFNLFPLALFIPGMVFYSWLNLSYKESILRGYLFGIGMFSTGVWWVYVSMNEFGGVPLINAVFLTALFILFLALFPAAVAWLSCLFQNRVPPMFHIILLMPSLWVLLEWIRSWIFTGFPWLSIGYSQVSSPLGGFSPFFGVYGTSLIVMLFNGFFTLLLIDAKRYNCIFLPAFFWIIVFGGMLSFLHWTKPSGDSIEVALLQGNISQDIKWQAKQQQPTIELYTQLSRENFNSDIIIWPETAMPMFYHRAKAFLKSLGAEANQNNSEILLGIPYVDLDTRKYYNSVVSIGNKHQFYHKQHLVPFGEYIPFGSLIGDIMKILNAPLPDFSRPETAQGPLSIAGHKMGISICYEDVFGEEVIQQLPEADILVNVSNDAWFGDSIAPHQHLQIASMRSLETGRPMLRATNTGITAIIDHKGKVQKQIPQFKAMALTGKVQPMMGRTPYSIWGNIPTVLFVITILIIAMVYSQKNINSRIKG